MKSLIIITLFICTLISCTKDFKKDFEFDAERYPQKWELIEMSGHIQNSVTMGAKMTWQEFYLLDANGTFIKYREQDGIVVKVSGNFSFEEKPDGKYLTLEYKTDNPIIGSCIRQKEILTFESNRLISTWWACDGPGLFYERTE